MKTIFKENDQTLLIGFIFDIFSKYSKSGLMNQSQIEDVLLVFDSSQKV